MKQRKVNDMDYLKKRRFFKLGTALLMTAAFILVAAFISHNEASAATKYPIIEKDGLRATLSKTYSFYGPDYSYEYTGDTTQYAYIYRNGKKYVKFKLPESRRMTCIGKYKGKYYFNVDEGGVSAVGVYSYKPGDKKFKRVCKNLNFESFKKEYRSYEYARKHSGIMGKRYILARRYFPTDAFDGFGAFYTYDLKKNKKRSLGDARDVICIGKKIYWTTTTPYEYGESKKASIVVKSSNCSGKKIETVKSIPFGNLGATYGSGSIDEQYVTWDFMVAKGDSYDSATIKQKYR